MTSPSYETSPQTGRSQEKQTDSPSPSPERQVERTEQQREVVKQRLSGLQRRVQELQDEVRTYTPIDAEMPTEDRVLSESFMAARKRQLEALALKLSSCYDDAERLNLVEQRPLQSESAPRLSENILTTPIREVFEQFQIKGTEAPLPNNQLFSSIVVLQKTVPATEPLVRVYRGVQKANAGLIRHIPYAMRSEDGSGGARIVEEARESVDRLAKEPTYQHFLDYVRIMQPHWTQKERARVTEEIRSLEDGVLSGRSVRDGLHLNQIQHLGGATMDSGLSPYVALSTDPKEALGYAGKTGNLIVMDVPLSKLGAFQSAGELNLLGSADDAYVTAVLPRKHEVDHLSEEELQRNLDQALSYLNQIAPVASDKLGAWHHTFKEQQPARQAEEEVRWLQDVALVREKRARDIAHTFRSAELNLPTLHTQAEAKGTDVYTEALHQVFDHYLDRFSRIGGTRQPRDMTEYDYRTNDGKTHTYDASKVDETMLMALRKLVGNLEERYG